METKTLLDVTVERVGKSHGELIVITVDEVTTLLGILKADFATRANDSIGRLGETFVDALLLAFESREPEEGA
jgi:hypothetical protein